MKYVAMTAALLMLATAGTASAKPGHRGHDGWKAQGKYQVHKRHRAGRLTPFERVAIARSRARLAKLRRRIRADGHVTRFERRRLQAAQIRHRRLVRRLNRS